MTMDVAACRCGLASVPPIGGVIVTNAGDAGASASSKAATRAGVKCSVGLLVKKDSKGGLKVRGFASGGPAERCGKIKVGMWLTYVDGAPVKGLQYTRLADLMQGEAGSKVTLTLVEKVGETPKSMQVVLVREPPREAVSVSHGRVRRMEAEAIDPVAAENALKNAQASALARTMAMESREQQNTAQGPGSAHQVDGGAEMVRGSEREIGRDGEAAEGGVDDEKRAWGVGIEFELDAYGNVLAKSVSQSCHAGRGGLAFAGDILKAVGGTAVKGLTIAEVDDLVRGEAGSEVRLSLQRHKRGMVSLLLNREVAVGPTPPPQPTCGVGITFKLRKDGLYHVKALAEGGPAAMSGYINIGDIVVSVDGVSIQGHTHQELAALVLGVDATPVDLVTLYRLPDGTMRPSSVRLYRAAIAATTSSGAGPTLSQPSSTGSASTSSLSSLPTPPASAGNVYKFAPAPRTEAGDKGDDGAGDQWAEKPAVVARMSV
jgi:C-terminal processing protease CtpA/Prc